MRRRARADGNQVAIARAAQAMGATVHYTHTVGEGFPDLVIGINGLNLLVEVKDPKQPRYDREKNIIQKDWHAKWKGQVACVETPEQMRDLIKTTKIIAKKSDLLWTIRDM